MHLSGLLLGQHSCVLPPTKGKWEEHSWTLCWQFFYFLRLENTLPLVVGVNVLQQLRYWFSRLRWSNFISINGIFQQSQMNICISHNGLGKKSQNVILWKSSHCLFFVNTVILIEIQLHTFLQKKLRVSEIYYFWCWRTNSRHLSESHIISTFSTEDIYRLIVPWGKVWRIDYCGLRCSWGLFWTSIVKAVGDSGGLVSE